MAAVDPLHTLIRSLSKAEKRHFKLFCRREATGDNYLKLFNAMDRQTKYDEAAIRRTFNQERFVRQLHVTKNYLRRLILKSLRNYHASISKDAELKDVLRNVEILYHKELYTACQQELKVAERLATQYEITTGLVEVETWKRKIIQTLEPHAYQTFNEILAKQRKAIDSLRTTNDSWMTAVHVTAGTYAQRQTVAVKNIILKAARDGTMEDAVVQHNAQYLLHLRNNEPDAAERELVRLIAMLEEFPQRIREAPGLYVSTINNLLSFYVFQKRFAEALTLIGKAKAVYERWKITAARRTLLKQIIRTYNIELEIYRDSGALHQNAGFIRSTENFVLVNAQKIPKDYLISFWFQLASIHFMQKNFAPSLEWVNKILNARFRAIRTDLYVQAHLLNLMLHLEYQNMMVLRYYVDSTKRYFKKHHVKEAYLDILLKFFVHMGQLPLLEYKGAYRQLRQSLFPETGPPLIPEDVLGYIDYRGWLLDKGNY